MTQRKDNGAHTLLHGMACMLQQQQKHEHEH
jgi:hypothetical protein